MATRTITSQTSTIAVTGKLSKHCCARWPTRKEKAMLKQKQRGRTEEKQKDLQIPVAVPVVDSTDILKQLADAADEGTDFEAMDDGVSMSDLEDLCSC